MKRNPIQDIVRVNNKISVMKDGDIVAKKSKVIKEEPLPMAVEHEEEMIEMKVKDINPTINTKIEPQSEPKTQPSTTPAYKPPVINNIPKVKNVKSKKKLYLFIVLALAFVGILYALSVVFAHATIYVKNKVQNFTFTDEVFNAGRTDASDIHFEIMIVDGDESKQMTFTETKELSTKAHGEVVIYNAFSKTPVKLLINTRLEDNTNNIYMTDKAVTIPGFTMSGTKVVPGSVTVGITASGVGDKYNGDPRDFVIFGYKGTVKATKIYARSKTSITGGATGLVYIPSATDKGTINTDISVALRNKLEKKLQAQVPPGYMFYPGSSQFKLDFNSENLTSKTPDAKVDAKATLSAILLKSDDLQKAIIKSAYASVPESEISEISVPDMDKLVFSYKNASELINKTTSTVSFTLNGEGNLIWNPDLEKLKNTIVGVPVTDLDKIFKSDPGIENARVILRPPWQKNLPKKASYISIKGE